MRVISCLCKCVLICGVFIILSGCGGIASKLVPTETTTGIGQKVTVIDPPRTGSRSDVPTGWKPKDTVVIKQQNGAETYVNKKTGQIAQNTQAQSITESIEVPKRSWAWAWILGGILALLITVNIVLKMYFGVNPFGWIFGKILKK